MIFGCGSVYGFVPMICTIWSDLKGEEVRKKEKGLFSFFAALWGKKAHEVIMKSNMETSDNRDFKPFR
jgi:hypothetical protein